MFLELDQHMQGKHIFISLDRFDNFSHQCLLCVAVSMNFIPNLLFVWFFYKSFFPDTLPPSSLCSNYW